MNDPVLSLSGGDRNVDLVIFDCDGVLIDSEHLACSIIVQTLSRFGVTITIDLLLGRLIGATEKSLPDQLASVGLNVPQAAYDALDQAILDGFRSKLKPIWGIAEFIADLEPKVCVASNSSLKRLKLSLSLTSLSHYFGNSIFSADMVEKGKPSPALFLHAASKLAVPPSNCLIIEDSTVGLRAAKAAGIPAIGFHGGAHCSSDHGQILMDHGAFLSCGSVCELRAALSDLLTPRLKVG